MTATEVNAFFDEYADAFSREDAERICKLWDYLSFMSDRPADSVDQKLLEILVCPMTKGALEYDAARQELISRSAKLAYPIRDGIPIMLPEEARKID